MKKFTLALIFIIAINTLIVPVVAKNTSVKTTEATASTTKSQEESVEQMPIIVKESQDTKYDDLINSNIDFLQKNLQASDLNGFDFTKIVSELKANKKLIVTNIFNQKIENSNLKYDAILNKLYDAIYTQYGKKFTIYTQDDIKQQFDKYLATPVEPGNTNSYTAIFVIKNKSTGLFISYVPMTIKISAAYDKLDSMKIKYTINIQALNYLQQAY